LTASPPYFSKAGVEKSVVSCGPNDGLTYVQRTAAAAFPLSSGLASFPRVSPQLHGAVCGVPSPSPRCLYRLVSRRGQARQ
jgi:hypothetical protein